MRHEASRPKDPRGAASLTTLSSMLSLEVARPRPHHISLSPSHAKGTQHWTPKTLSSDMGFACLITSLSNSQQASNYKKDICATVWIAKKGKSSELQEDGSRDRLKCLNLLVQVGMKAATPQGGLFCHAGSGGQRGDSSGDQGSTAAIIHLLSWQCPVSQVAHVTKHNSRAFIVALCWSAAMCKWS